MGLLSALLLVAAPAAALNAPALPLVPTLQEEAARPEGASAKPPVRLLVLAKNAAAAEVVDLDQGKVVATVKVGDGPHEVALSPDGTTAAVADYGGRTPGSTLTLIALDAERVVRKVELGEGARPHGLIWESDSRHIWVTAEGSGELLRVDVATAPGVSPVVARVSVGEGTLGHMVAAADDRRQYVSHIASGMVTPVIDGKAMEPVKSGAGCEGIAVRPGGRELWLTNRADGTVVVFPLTEDGLDTTPENVKRMACPGFPIRVVFTPDGSTALVTCAEAGEVEVFAAEEKTSLGRVKMPLPDGAAEDASTDPIGVTTSRDGKFAYVSLSAADHIAELDIAALKVLRLIPTGKTPDGIAWYLKPGRPQTPGGGR